MADSVEFTGPCCRFHRVLVTIVDTPSRLHPDGYVRTVEGTPIAEWRAGHEPSMQMEREQRERQRQILLRGIHLP
jgi:hypothetical protein